MINFLILFLDKFPRKCQVIVGTPKEIVAYRMLGVFNLKNVTTLVIDDADVVATSHLVNMHLINQVSEQCQVIMMSLTFNKKTLQQVSGKFIQMKREEEIPETIQQFAIHQMATENKIHVLRKICDELNRNTNGQAIVFCNVCYVFIYRRFHTKRSLN